MLNTQKLVKYVLEGAAVAAAAFYIPQRTIDLKEVAIIALTAAAVFAVLDHFAPSVSSSARQGAGFGIGYNITKGLEGFEDETSEDETTDSDSNSESDSSEDSTDSEDNGPTADDPTGEAFASVM